MKNTILILTFLFAGFLGMAQTRERKVDSVCVLVKQYFNEKNAEKLYSLCGEKFKGQLSEQVFTQLCQHNLFPIGEIERTIGESYVNGIGKYKVVCSSVNLTLLLSLDQTGKIETFLFQPYQEDAVKDFAVPTNNPLNSALDKEVDSAVRTFMSLRNTVGLSLGILVGNRVYYYGYGETGRGNHHIPAPNTLFEIGSITKTFTATLLADAVDKRKLKLDDPLNKFLPDSIGPLEYDHVPITLLTLANHTSGLPRMPDNIVLSAQTLKDPYSEYGDNQLFRFYKHFKTVRRPGASYDYSNLGMGTLGVALERVNHASFETLVVKTICNPLGMKDTRQSIRKPDSSRFAKGYDANGEYAGPWNFKALAGAGALRSTAADLLKYAKANLGKAPGWLNKDIQLTHYVTFNSSEATVGLAWHYIHPGADTLLFHNGETGGYFSYLAIDLDKRFAIVLLSNAAIDLDQVGNNLMVWLEKH
ncbi:MAG TPA: serine hydrolase [Chitinophagaceae bacterium]|nr:serine hydrolase [Chitinophagaceae bacterium]